MSEKIAIISHEREIRDSYAEFLCNWGNFQIAIAASSHEQFREEYLRLKISLDCVLCDIDLPGRDGIEAIAGVKKVQQDVPVMVLTEREQDDRIIQALCLGATGYVLKSTPLEKIAEGIHDLMGGGAVLSPKLAIQVANFFNATTQGNPKNSRRLNQDKLTVREVEVLTLLQKGHSNKKIAEILFVSVDTIKYHIRNIYAKMHITSRKDLLIKFHPQFIN